MAGSWQSVVNANGGYRVNAIDQHHQHFHREPHWPPPDGENFNKPRSWFEIRYPKPADPALPSVTGPELQAIVERAVERAFADSPAPTDIA